jgi:hypothetical protein
MVKRHDTRTERNLVRAASSSPAALRMVGSVFDTVWAPVVRDFGDHPDEIETARIQVAAIIFDLARDGQLGPHQIAHTADRLIRQTHIEGVQNRTNPECLMMSDKVQPMRVPAFGPEALNQLQHCFDDAWQEVAGNFAADAADAARSKLASLILSLASITKLAPKELVEASPCFMRESARS